MNSPVRILLLEDDPADAALTLLTLEKNGIPHQALRVETEADFMGALRQGGFDLILSDCSLPSFDGRTALRLAQKLFADRAQSGEAPGEVPFIFVSGTIGEEVAIETLKSGATDYVMKQRLSRLAPAVRRALSEAAERDARRAADRSRLEAETLFRSLFDQVAVGVAVSAPDGRIIRANPALATLLGYNEDQLAALYLAQLVHAEDAAIGEAEHAELCAGQRANYEVEQRLVRRDGAVLRMRVVVSLIRDDGGAPRYVIRLLEDITERKEMQQRFLQAQKMEAVGRLAAGIAHDFNNLLTVINGYSALLLQRGPQEGPENRQLKEILKAGGRARTLSQRLLALSRQQTAQTSRLDINAVLTGLEPMLRHITGEEVQVVLRLHPDAGWIEADESQIEQIVMNLVINARDAMDARGKITIETDHCRRTAAAGGDSLILSVADTGQGMDETVRSRIFEPFFTTKELGKGTGLGLWMVYEIIQQSRGTIAVESQPGAGTRFRICLPRIVPPGVGN